MTVFKTTLMSLQNLSMHKFRSFLTTLGIVFGVASVICMLSISTVAKRETIEQIEQLGVQNIIVNSTKPQALTKKEEHSQQGSWIAKYGVKIKELEMIKESIPAIESVVPVRFIKKDVWAGDRKIDVHIAATTDDYSYILNHGLSSGSFITDINEKNLAQVCILGHEAKKKLFPLENPIGKSVKIGSFYMQVIGVLEKKGFKSGGAIQIENPDNMVFIPYQTSVKRFGFRQVKYSQGVYERTEVEVDRAIIKVKDVSQLAHVALSIENLLGRMHKETKDWEIILPYELLRQHKKAQHIFMIVMTSIAAISLLVGGIGIMNIMLANIAERSGEIGLRRAIGATQADILSMFLLESIILSVGGAILGIGTGVGLAYLFSLFAGWSVTINVVSIGLGLGVAIVVGIIFGTLPAYRASKLDPVTVLREG